MAQKAQTEHRESKYRGGRFSSPRVDSGLVRRLRQSMELRGVNPLALAGQAEVGPSFVYDILNGKSANPTTRNLSAVARVLGVGLSYLLHGEEELSPGGSYAGSPLASSSAAGELAAIQPVYAETVHGGAKPYYFHRAWIEKKLRTSPENLRVIFVGGDGMEPTLGEHDMALVDIARKTPAPPGIFAISDGTGLTVKRLEHLGEKDGKAMIRVGADNPRYGNYEWPLESLGIVGRVVWFARQLG